MIHREMGKLGVVHFLRGLPNGRFRVAALENQDFFRTASILDQYSDSRIDCVDATVIAVAERLQMPRTLTLDRRDFEMVRPTHIAHFDLLPQ